MFRSNDSKIRGSLSNVRHWRSVRMVRGIMTTNPFANMNLGGGKAPRKRCPIPTENIFNTQTLCGKIDDDMRWIVATISDSGMRLAEVIGLQKDDRSLDVEIPFLRLSEHPWRRLKTSTSKRDVPLVGAALWGLKRALDEAEGPLLFPRYCTLENNKANYASSALNKWLKAYVPDGCVVHSFRHSLRDRLRAVGCPSDIVDQIGALSIEFVLSIGETNKSASILCHQCGIYYLQNRHNLCSM